MICMASALHLGVVRSARQGAADPDGVAPEHLAVFKPEGEASLVVHLNGVQLHAGDEVLRGDLLLGILLFYGVQVAYMVRICKANGGYALLIPRFLLFSLLLVALYQLELFTPETAAAALYFSHFLFNALLSLSLRDAGGRLFSLGLLLYLMCDMLVAVSQFPSLFPAPLSSVAQVGMWLFYLPGQVLIVLSGLVIPTGGVPDETE